MGYMVTRLRGYTVTWLHGYTVTWVAWLHGSHDLTPLLPLLAPVQQQEAVSSQPALHGFGGERRRQGQDMRRPDFRHAGLAGPGQVKPEHGIKQARAGRHNVVPRP